MINQSKSTRAARQLGAAAVLAAIAMSFSMAAFGQTSDAALKNTSRKETLMKATWFEIPATQMERAVKFYSAVFGLTISVQNFGQKSLAWLDQGRADFAGAIAVDPKLKPGPDGPVLFFSGGDDLSTMLNRVEAAGGKVLVPKTAVGPEMGFYAILLDTEGNRIGLQSKQ